MKKCLAALSTNYEADIPQQLKSFPEWYLVDACQIYQKANFTQEFLISNFNPMD